MEFSQKTILVTGAAQGIGAAAARHFAKEGGSVIVADINFEKASAVAQEIKGTPFALDLGQLSQQESLLETLSSVDVLVNAAGICITQDVNTITYQGWQKTFDINVEGLFFLSRWVCERLSNEGKSGAVVNLASISGFLPKLEQVDYGASKAAIVSVTRSLALIYGPKGIRVNAVAPGVIDTPLTQTIAEQRGQVRGVAPLETLEPVLKSTPLGRMGTAEEVAEAIAFLASDRASFITGQTLNVCGGLLMR